MSARGTTWRLVACLLCLLSCARAFGQDPQQVKRRRVDLVVTTSTDRAVFVDMGLEQGLAEEDFVTFFPVGEPAVRGIVRTLSANHARIELLDTQVALPTGTRGEVWVLPSVAPVQDEDTVRVIPPVADEQAAPPQSTSTPASETTPWRTPPEDWTADRPLLSDPATTARVQRPSTLHGRVSTSIGLRHSRLNGERNNAYVRTGTDWTLDNPFGDGGRMSFSGELYGRSSTGTGVNDQQTDARLWRFSYEQPGDADSPRRWILGRYVSRAMPEFGWVDGAEYAQRLGPQDEVGASAGHVPQLGNQGNGDNYQAAVFYRHLSDRRTPLDWRIGYQKTFHAGSQDRDLLVADARYHTLSGAFVSSTLWLDNYGPDEEPKSEGPEITRLYLSTGKSTPQKPSWRASYSELRFPLLKSDGIVLTPPAGASNLYLENTRHLSFDVWGAFSPAVRYRSRVDRWNTRGGTHENGLFADAGVTLQQTPWERSQLALSSFVSLGDFSDTSGVLFDVYTRMERGSWRLGMELDNIQDSPPASQTENSLQTLLRSGWTTSPAEDWNLTLDGNLGWGDLGKTLSLVIYLQWSF